MANMAEVSYKLVGDKKELKAVYNALKYMDKRKTSIVKNGWGKLWLGCLVTKLGGDWHEIECRGEILDYNLEDEILTINQETAWGEQSGFRHFLQHTFPSVKVFYQEEEPGCEVFYTNDLEGTYFPDRYFLDSYEEQEYFQTIEEAAKYISNIIGKYVEPDYDKLCEALDAYVEDHEEEDEDLFYSLHEFKYADD